MSKAKVTLSTKDSEIVRLMELARQQRAEIKELEGATNFKTNCSYTFNGNSVNLRVADMPVLVRVLSQVYMDADFVQKASASLGYKEKYFQWGYSFADWEHDIKLCAKRLEIKTKKEKLDKTEKVLEGLKSEDLKAEQELARIREELGVE